jgi:uncharacterized membrane protein
MIRKRLAKRKIGDKAGFVPRSAEVSRLEGLSDAVFGFAMTLLVVSLDVPNNADELFDAMRGFAAFGVCFLVLAGVWYQHYVFFRRYGLQDGLTILINGGLLFVILFYIYPLKFLFSWLLASWAPFFRPSASAAPNIQASQIPLLLIIYGAGFALTFLFFALLYAHAYRQRARLGLSEVEVFDTRESIQYNLVLAAVGVISITIAAVGGTKFAGLAEASYFLIPPLMIALDARSNKLRRRLEEK